METKRILLVVLLILAISSFAFLAVAYFKMPLAGSQFLLLIALILASSLFEITGVLMVALFNTVINYYLVAFYYQVNNLNVLSLDWQGNVLFPSFTLLIIGLALGKMKQLNKKIQKGEEIKLKETEGKRQQLEEAKKVLEIRVEAKTKQLKEQARELEEKFKERTEELKKNLMDLERFQRLAVGRELRMIELKKQIKEFQEKLKNK